jgi:hypothetical protein
VIELNQSALQNRWDATVNSIKSQASAILDMTRGYQDLDLYPYPHSPAPAPTGTGFMFTRTRGHGCRFWPAPTSTGYGLPFPSWSGTMYGTSHLWHRTFSGHSLMCPTTSDWRNGLVTRIVPCTVVSMSPYETMDFGTASIYGNPSLSDIVDTFTHPLFHIGHIAI